MSQKIDRSIITVNEMIEHAKSGYITGPPLKKIFNIFYQPDPSNIFACDSGAV
jgi:hypothetical protein